MESVNMLAASINKKPASPMKTNGLNAFDVVGCRIESNTLLSDCLIDEAQAHLMSKPMHLARLLAVVYSIKPAQ